MSGIAIEIVSGDGVEQCRDLCNELMAFQKSRAVVDPQRFDGMNFDTRMKKSYENALRSHVAVLKDDGLPVGYVFSTVDDVPEAARNTFPDWAPKQGTGFYPDWVVLPQKVGCLSNLYLRDGYRSGGWGAKLLDLAMRWFWDFSDVDLVFVYISNGNDPAMRFYLKNGFTYSHEVFGGFISAACLDKTKKNA